MPRVGFEPTISAGERPKTYALDCAATGTGLLTLLLKINSSLNYVSNTVCFRVFRLKDSQCLIDALSVDRIYLKHQHQGRVPDYMVTIGYSSW